MVQPGLEERLTRLVDGPVDTVVPSADQLWKRGRRWGRRSRLVNAGISLCTVALLAGIGIWGSQGLPGVAPGDPADSRSEVGLPSRVHASLSSRMPYLTDPGELVAVTAWSHTTWWGRSEPAVAAISARTGEYGFVETPDRAGEVLALSPGGRRLAYWTAGTPSGSPNTTRENGETLTGLAVLDSVTGEVVRHDFETEHGVTAEDLFWLDDRRLVVEPYHLVVGDDGPVEEQGAARADGGFVLDATTGEVSAWAWPNALPVMGWARAGEQILVSEPTSRLLDQRTVRAIPVGLDKGQPDQVEGDPVVSIDGEVARVASDDSGLMSVWVARLGRPGANGQWREVSRRGQYVNEVLGWRDGRIVAFTGGEASALVLLDPRDGETQTLVEIVDEEGRGDVSVGWSWATDLLQTADVVDGEEPAYPVNPLLAVGAVAGVLAAAAIALVWWRRRGHP